MSKKEQEILEQLRETVGEVEIPERISPVQMEQILFEKGKKRSKKRVYAVSAAAACCLMVCGAVWTMQKSDVITEPDKLETTAKGESDSAEIQTAEDYEQVFQYLEAYENELGQGSAAKGARNLMLEGEAETATADMATDQAASSGSGGYSETNVRQAGVDEADVVKTDGTYLYTLKDNGTSVAIVDTTGEVLAAVSQAAFSEEEQVAEFYVNDGKLILIGETYKEVESGAWRYDTCSTVVETYDITDPAHPEQISRVTQSGQYNSSRVAEGYLYLFTQYSASASGITPRDQNDYIPYINGKIMAASDIYLPPNGTACMYQVISAVDLSDPSEIYDSKALFSDGGSLYVSNDNIFWYEAAWKEEVTTTIRRISYKDGELKAEASGTVDGYINDSFSIDEYDGYLRVVTTNAETSGLYVLNRHMEVVGEVTGLAEDERVYSARLLGETGYFVTYKETDPLFSVDLSDPEHPEILGELKIPGFSEYLHFYGEDRLLGIGMDVDEESFATNGVKLSMFDISDNTDVKETQKYVLENVYGTSVTYDYRAALIDPEENMIGFAADDQAGETYFVFSYDDAEGFQCRMRETVNGNGYEYARGVYVDDTLYVIKGNIIEAYDRTDYRKTGDLIL